MQKIKFLFFCILMIVLGFVCTKFIQGYYKPQLKLVTDIHDFGNIYKGENASFYIKFKNIGKADLRLTNVEEGCGCTIADWSMNSIAPGEMDSIFVTYDSEIVGTIDRRVTIYSNDSVDPYIFYIVGNVHEIDQ